MTASLSDYLREHSLQTNGPYELRSGSVTDWYVDARKTTFDGPGAWLVGSAVLGVLASEAQAVGGMTMGADPIAVATAMVAWQAGRKLAAFSIRKAEKGHGLGGRIVGPLTEPSSVAIVEDTTTTGSAMCEAAEVLADAGHRVVQAIAVVDRSNGGAGVMLGDLGIPFVGLVSPEDLGVGP